MSSKSLEFKQKITATIVIFVMVFMVFSTLEFKNILAQSNVIMTQAVAAGTLTLSTVTSIAFNSSITAGSATNSLGKVLVVNVLDYRGSGAGWTAATNASDFWAHGVAGPGNVIASTTSYILPTTSSDAITAFNGASTSGIAKGADSAFGPSAGTIMNASTNNGMGAYYLGNIQLNVVYNGNAAQKVGTYTATSTMTIT